MSFADFDRGHVASDLFDTAERDDAHRIIRGRRDLGGSVGASEVGGRRVCRPAAARLHRACGPARERAAATECAARIIIIIATRIAARLVAVSVAGRAFSPWLLWAGILTPAGIFWFHN